MENANYTLKEVESHIQNGFYNTAVNRMYYACYYAASAMLIAKGVETKSLMESVAWWGRSWY
jgi:uncharacterized protein (UPF0332 family)